MIHQRNMRFEVFTSVNIKILSTLTQQVRSSLLHIPTRLHSFTSHKFACGLRPRSLVLVVDYLLGHLTACRSKAWICTRSPAEIVGSNPIGVMDVCLL